MNILQKEDLAAASFANTNTNAAGGVAIRTDAGSTVGAAIAAATPAAQTLSIAGQTLSLSGGGGSIAVPSTVFATPAETIAGVDTGKAVDPADLTAKLANQPASGACTDREDVVWNGTILQGAAKHYSFSGALNSVWTPMVAGDVWQSGIPASSPVTTINNPSSCRTLRVHLLNVGARVEGADFTVTASTNQLLTIYANATPLVGALGFAARPTTNMPIYVAGATSANYSNCIAYFDIAAGGSANFRIEEVLGDGQVICNTIGAHGASAGFIAQTI